MISLSLPCLKLRLIFPHPYSRVGFVADLVIIRLKRPLPVSPLNDPLAHRLPGRWSLVPSQISQIKLHPRGVPARSASRTLPVSNQAVLNTEIVQSEQLDSLNFFRCLHDVFDRCGGRWLLNLIVTPTGTVDKSRAILKHAISHRSPLAGFATTQRSLTAATLVDHRVFQSQMPTAHKLRTTTIGPPLRVGMYSTSDTDILVRQHIALSCQGLNVWL